MPELLPFIFHFSFLHFSLKLSASSTSMSLGSASGSAAASCWRMSVRMKSRLVATDGVVNHDPIPVFLIHMAVQRIAGVAVAQRCGHVAAHEERLALGVGDGTDRTEVAVIEDLNVVVCSFHNVVEFVRRRSESLAIYSRTSSSPRLIARCLFSGGNKCYLYCFFFNHELHALGIPKGDA